MRSATATGDYTLPRHKGTRDRSRQPFPGCPTWVRRDVGARQFERIRPERLPDIVDATNRAVQVWSIPASAWSPRDHIEIGPLLTYVRIEFEVDDQYSMAAAFLPNARPWGTRPLHNPNT